MAKNMKINTTINGNATYSVFLKIVYFIF